MPRRTYRMLRSDEPNPAGEPLTYNATCGRVIQRWKVSPHEYVERSVRREDGSPLRWKAIEARRVDVAEARRRYEQGETLPAIAEALGCDSATLSRALRRVGVNMRTATDYARPLDIADAARRYRDGEGHRSIARDMGLSPERVLRALRDAGAVLRPVGRVKGRGQRGRSVTYQTEFLAQRPKVRERSGGVCEAQVAPTCSGRASHVHHILPRGQGGTNDLANLLDTCPFCHMSIHANPASSYERGFLLRRMTS